MTVETIDLYSRFSTVPNCIISSHFISPLSVPLLALTFSNIVFSFRTLTFSYITFSFLSSQAMGIKMVLSGEGADEIFAGYLYFHKCPNPEEMQAELKDKIR